MNEGAGSGPGTKPGERLRAERERRGFSTQKVAEDLHVDVWVVEALESGRHESLGAPVFVKGHLRKYALLLGLDADELLLAFGEQAPPPLVRLTPKARTRPPRRMPIKALLIAALVIVLAAAGFLGYRYWRSDQKLRSSETGTSVMAAIADAPKATLAAGSPTAASPAAGSRAVSQASAVPSKSVAPSRQTVRVRLSFSADSWVELYDGSQKRMFFDMGAANSARGFTVAAPARVFLGYADGVQVEIDGRPVTLDAGLRRDNVAHFTVDARGRLAPAGSLSRP